MSIEIEDLEKKKKNIQYIQIRQPASATILSVKQIKTKRNVTLASVLGLFLMIFLTFFIEYISRHKNSDRRGEA